MCTKQVQEVRQLFRKKMGVHIEKLLGKRRAEKNYEEVMCRTPKDPEAMDEEEQILEEAICNEIRRLERQKSMDGGARPSNVNRSHLAGARGISIGAIEISTINT